MFSEIGKTVCTRPLPKVVSPTIRARSWSCSAPETISAAEAVLRFTSTTIGYFQVRALGRAIDLVREGAAVLRNHDLALLQELVRDIDRLVQQAAGVAAQVDQQTMNVGPELVQRSCTSREVVSMKLVTWM